MWAVIAKRDFDAVVNIQGDEPLIPEKLVDEVRRALATAGRRQRRPAQRFLR